MHVFAASEQKSVNTSKYARIRAYWHSMGFIILKTAYISEAVCGEVFRLPSTISQPKLEHFHMVQVNCTSKETHQYGVDASLKAYCLHSFFAGY